MNIVLVQFLDFKLLKKISKLSQIENNRIITLSNAVVLNLQAVGIPFTDFSEYINPEDFRIVNDAAVETARNWYKQKDIVDICTCDGINMGEFSELFLTGYFIEVFKRIIILEKIYARYHPSKIIYSSNIEPFNMGPPENLWAYVIKAFTQKDNIETTALKKDHKTIFFLKEKLKYRFEKWHLLMLFQGGVSVDTFWTYLKYVLKRFSGGIKKNGKSGIIFTGPANLLIGSVKLMSVLIEKGYSVEALVREDFEAKKIFMGYGIPTQTFTEVRMDGQYRRRIRNKVKNLKSNISQNISLKKLKPFLFNNVDIWPVIYRRLYYELKYIYPRLVEEMEIFRYKISKEKDIKCVISPSSVAPEARSILKQASAMGISTAEIQHGVTKWAPSYLPVVADAVLVWGKMTKDWYLRHGVESNRIFITGRITSTRKKNTGIDIDNLRRKLNLPYEKKIILVATQPVICIDSLTRLKGNIPIIQAIVDELVELENIMLVVKLHPAERLSDYDNVRAGHSNILITKYGDAQDYLELCDILIVGDSSIAVDAMIKNKPVIYVNFDGSEDLVNYPQYGACPVYDRKGILPSVKAFLYNGSKNYNHDKINEMISCEGPEAVKEIFRTIFTLIKEKAG
ncbi:MAG: CDP-glycerol glycerophosphotransferase family protein [Sedimentisphaerales bacterium]